MVWTRRQFLRLSAASAASLIIPGSLEQLFAAAAAGNDVAVKGYGPLAPDPKRLLDLPEGFQYRALSVSAVAGTPDAAKFASQLTNGDPTPPRHDGMAAFAGPPGVTVLVRNHEVNLQDLPAVDPGRARPYDPLSKGGTTTLWIGRDRSVVRSFASLSGTIRNCGGGRTPWGSWLTCEECTYMPGAPDGRNADLTASVSKPHGYVFEVDARATALVDPVPIHGMGRFYHEAVAVDPDTGFVYLTEDRNDGLLYRYRPRVVTSGTRHPSRMKVGDLAAGGALEALRVTELPQALTQNWNAPTFAPRKRWKVDWVAIPDLEPECDLERDLSDPEPDVAMKRTRTAAGSTRGQGFRLGCAQFARTEGITYHAGAVYFCCTNGGKARLGQVWALDLRAQELSLVVEPNDVSLLNGPDNLTRAPNGDLIVCEDGGQGEDRVIGITPTGKLYTLARNALNTREFAGATFSPDGHTLFVNLQDPGITFAIWGPWERRTA